LPLQCIYVFRVIITISTHYIPKKSSLTCASN